MGRKALFLLALLAPVPGTYAQVLPPASSALQSINAQTGAKATALGGAFSSIADDTAALYWNPAGLAWTDRVEVQTSYNQWFQDTFFQDLGAVFPVGWGGVGGRLSYVNFGSFETRDLSGAVLGSQTPQAFSASVGGAYRWQKLGVGLLVKGALESYSGSSVIGVGLDGGLLYRDIWGSVAGGLRNVGTANGYGLPIEFYLGASRVLGGSHSQWTLSTDVGFPQGPAVFHHGLEWSYEGKVFFRAGYQWVTQPAPLQDQAGLGGGMGVNLGDFKVDYSIVSNGDLGWTNKLAVAYDLEPAPAQAVERTARSEAAQAPASAVATTAAAPTASVPSPSGMKELYDQGMRAYRTGDYKEAAHLLKRAVESPSEGVEPFYYAEAYAMLGVLFEYHAKFEGHLKTAQKYYRKALEKEPGNATARKHLKD